LENIFFEKMTGDTKCPNCAKEGSTIPLSEDKPFLAIGKKTKHYSFEKHVCSTCKKIIDYEISRILITRNKDWGPRLFCFHFFFPCWDWELFCQKYPNLIIEKAGFSFPENLIIKEYSINDLRKNLEYWT